jgi:hypothetical protein
MTVGVANYEYFGVNPNGILASKGGTFLELGKIILGADGIGQLNRLPHEVQPGKNHCHEKKQDPEIRFT